MQRQIVKYNPGEQTNFVAFMFACPGQAELNNNIVLAGATGANLNGLLEELNSLCPGKFPFTDRYKYLLTNASEQVYFKGYITKNRTLPLFNDDVYQETNLERLIQELGSKQIIIAFGKHAKKAINKIRSHLNGIICIESKYHLGMQGINHIKKDVNDNDIQNGANDATKLRLAVVAKDIINMVMQGENQ